MTRATLTEPTVTVYADPEVRLPMAKMPAGSPVELYGVVRAHGKESVSVKLSDGRFGYLPGEASIRLDDGRRYLVNVGSVGQPRDRDPRAAYTVWDRDARTVTIRRVAYDHRTAAEKILAAGLPRVLADRLADGV